MTQGICPYCRGPVAAGAEEHLVCQGCDTPHHRDCYDENRGCTVFGCRCAPADEPKLTVSAPELTQVAAAAQAPGQVSRPHLQRPLSREELPAVPAPDRVVRPTSYSPLGLSALWAAPALSTPAAMRPEAPERHRSKMKFVLLGTFLGAFGAHNFYAGYMKNALAQLAITVFTLGYGIPMSWLWAIIEVCTLEKDSKGIQFKS